MKQIGPNHGIEATRKRLQEVDPLGPQVAYDRLFGEPGDVYPSSLSPVEGTLKKLVANSNETIGRMETLEAFMEDALSRPF